MIRRPPRSTLSSSSAASDVYKRQVSTQSTGVAFNSMSPSPDGEKRLLSSSPMVQSISGAARVNRGLVTPVPAETTPGADGRHSQPKRRCRAAPVLYTDDKENARSRAAEAAGEVLSRCDGWLPVGWSCAW
eukprot:TRINITY_DN12171_c0_g1_i1.p1 TRINITY_DN12171_c0_g1~~TRINITY_DN12171_c0_g1_i1.p1  ORF type:complete len:131 (-),score=24.08 TRINITY_DN12171_c0_g1_i1:349-741(-)